MLVTKSDKIRALSEAGYGTVEFAFASTFAAFQIVAGFLVDRIGIAVDNQAGEVLAADLVLESARPIDEKSGIEAQRRGLQVARNATYPLHPDTLAHRFAAQHRGRTLCLEVRRDLLVPEFTPVVELHCDAQKVDRVATALTTAVVDAMPDRARAG